MHSSRIRLEDVAEPARLREAFLKAARGKWTRADVRGFAVTWLLSAGMRHHRAVAFQLVH